MAKEPKLAIVTKLLDEARTHQRYSSAIVDPRAETWCEAAAIIKDLVEALYQLHAETLLFLKREGKQVGVTGPGRALYDRVERALTRAGANNDQSK